MPSSDNGYYAPGGMEWSDAYEADAIQKEQEACFHCACHDAKERRCCTCGKGVA